MLDFVMKHTKKGECPLAGNTIYMDKIFLMKYMPRFVDHLHYRLVDVSTVKELARYSYTRVTKYTILVHYAVFSTHISHTAQTLFLAL